MGNFDKHILLEIWGISYRAPCLQNPGVAPPYISFTSSGTYVNPHDKSCRLKLKKIGGNVKKKKEKKEEKKKSKSKSINKFIFNSSYSMFHECSVKKIPVRG